MKGEVGYISYR